MWKLVIILSVVLSASIAMRQSFRPSSSESDVIRIGRYLRSFNKTIDDAIEKIKVNADKILYKRSNFWNTLNKRYDNGPAMIHFDENSEDWDSNHLIDDSACRRYVKTFRRSEIDRCANILRWSMYAEQSEIKLLSEKVIKSLARGEKIYLDCAKGENRDENNEGLCGVQFQRIRELSRIATNWILDILSRADKKMASFFEDLSYCLMVQLRGSTKLFDEWYDACSFYTKV